MLCEPILLTRAQIDAQRWNDHIRQSRQCVIYALSWYLDIICPEWEALVWPSAAEYAIMMPLPVRRKLGLRALHQPLFCQYLGIFSKQELTAGQCCMFITALATHFNYISAYAFNPDNYAVMSGLKCLKDFHLNTLQTHWLDLGQTYQEVNAGYSKDRRANLKRGIKAGWTISESRDFEPLVELFKSHHAARIGRVSAQAYEVLTSLGQHCLKEGAATLFYARSDEQIHAGVLITHFSDRAIYLFNAADTKARKDCARTVILDDWFRSRAGSMRFFDFESPLVASIGQHYRGYGASAVPFYELSRNALPFPIRQMQQLRKWFFRTRQCLYAALCRISNPFPKSLFSDRLRLSMGSCWNHRKPKAPSAPRP